MHDQNFEKNRWFVDEVLPHEADLRGWLHARFPSLGDVDDLVQDTFSRMLKACESGPIANPRAFLFVVARNLALNHLRRLGYERPPHAEEVDPLSVVEDVNAPWETVARREELNQLVRAIQLLPERCRQIMTLRKIYGLSQKEVAERLGISVNTVEVQGAIGLRKCIEHFRRLGYMTRFRA